MKTKAYRKKTDGRFEISDQKLFESVEKTHATKNEKNLSAGVMIMFM